MPDFIKDTTLKKYIADTEDFRIAKDAYAELDKQIVLLIQMIIKQSKKLALDNDRNTIMLRDIKEIISGLTGKKPLTWEELSQELTKLGPIELGNISKGIDKYIEQQK